MASSNYFYGLGRRKSSSARVRLTSGKGSHVIDGQSFSDYFGKSQKLLSELHKPFKILELDPQKYNLSVKVNGGGHVGQVDAIKLGIAKALATLNEDFRPTLKRADLLGRDPRERERKKAGLKSARKKRQFTKR